MDQSKFFSDIFSNSAMSQALARTNAISSLYRSALPAKLNLEATESIRRSLSFASKIYVPQNNFRNAASALSSYSELINRSSGIASKAFADNLLINSTNTLKNLMTFSNQMEVNKAITQATRTNIKFAIAYDRLIKIMNGSLTNQSMHVPRNPSVKMEEMDEQSYQGASNLENSEAVFEDGERSPTETPSDNNVVSKDFNQENIDFEKYFLNFAQQLSDDGYGLPSVVQILFSVALSIHNFLKTAKDETELYIFWGNIIYWIYYAATHIH